MMERAPLTSAESRPLPAGLRNLPVEQQEALQVRMRQELARQETLPPRTNRFNSRHMFYKGINESLYSILFLVLLLMKKYSVASSDGLLNLRWSDVFVPLYMGYGINFISGVTESYKSFRAYQRSGRVRSVWDKFLIDCDWIFFDFARMISAYKLANYLDAGDWNAAVLISTFSTLWIYGVVSSLFSILYCWSLPGCPAAKKITGWLFRAACRTVPVFLIIYKINGNEISWTTALIPYRLFYGALGFLGIVVAVCMMPCLSCYGCFVCFTSRPDTPVSRLVKFFAILGALIIVLGVSSVTFMSNIVQYLNGNPLGYSLFTVIFPLIVMHADGLLILVFLFVSSPRILNQSTQQDTVPHGVERQLSHPETLMRQTSTLFTREVVKRKTVFDDLESQDEPSDELREDSPTMNPLEISVGDEGTDSSSDTSRNDHQCYICMDASRDAVLEPCGHGGLCYKCAVDLGRDRSSVKPRCPLCRKEIDEVLHLMDSQGSGKFILADTAWLF